MNYKSNLIQQFSERGYIHQATDIGALDELAANRTISKHNLASIWCRRASMSCGA